MQVLFSEPVTSFALTDMVVTNAVVANLTQLPPSVVVTGDDFSLEETHDTLCCIFQFTFQPAVPPQLQYQEAHIRHVRACQRARTSLAWGCLVRSEQGRLQPQFDVGFWGRSTLSSSRPVLGTSALVLLASTQLSCL